MSQEPDIDINAILRVLADHDPDRCTVAPSPDLADKLQSELSRIAATRRIQDLPVDVSFHTTAATGVQRRADRPGQLLPARDVGGAGSQRGRRPGAAHGHACASSSCSSTSRTR